MSDTEASVPTTADRRAEALAAAELFRDRLLPGFLRRLSAWKGLDPLRRRDLVEDLEQDLFLDALEHADTIFELDERDRNARWFAVLQTKHYRNAQRADRLREPTIDLTRIEDHRWIGVADAAGLDGLTPTEFEMLQGLEQRGIHLGNGRLALLGTARRLDCSPLELRHLWLRVAAELGHDDDREAFWRARLVEAIIDEAALLLLDAGHTPVVAVPPPPRSESDRIRRYQRIRTALETRPLDEPLRGVLRRTAPRRDRVPRPVESLLDEATALAPSRDRVLLWCFENAWFRGDLSSAVRCVRTRRTATRLGEHSGWTGAARQKLRSFAPRRRNADQDSRRRPRLRQARSVRALDQDPSNDSRVSISSFSSA